MWLERVDIKDVRISSISGNQIKLVLPLRDRLQFDVSHQEKNELHYIGTAFVDIADLLAHRKN